MTGYCALCGVRLESPPAVPLLAAERARAEFMGLAALLLRHMTESHQAEMVGLAKGMLNCQTFLAAWLLEAPAPALGLGGGQPHEDLEGERARFVAEIRAWFASERPVEFRRVQPAGGAGSGGPPILGRA